jgi:broad specificity phosphatase PhoE
MPGVHINREGQKQAERLAAGVKERFVLSEVVSSPMERAMETATYVASAQGLQVTTDEDVIEVDFGEWKGKTFEELGQHDDWKAYNAARATTWPPGGESMLQVQNRAWRSLAQIVIRHKDEENATVAVVSHGDVVRGLLLLMLGMPIDLIHRLEIAPASASEVLLGVTELRVINVNQVF